MQNLEKNTMTTKECQKGSKKCWCTNAMPKMQFNAMPKFKLSNKNSCMRKQMQKSLQCRESRMERILAIPIGTMNPSKTLIITALHWDRSCQETCRCFLGALQCTAYGIWTGKDTASINFTNVAYIIYVHYMSIWAYELIPLTWELNADAWHKSWYNIHITYIHTCMHTYIYIFIHIHIVIFSQIL